MEGLRMFWILLIALYIVTFPINLFLMKNYWLRSFPPVKYQHLGEEIPGHVIFNAQKKAILYFGVIQPILASIPTIYGNEWYHYLICAGASMAYASSGSPTSRLDTVRSSYLMFLSTLIIFGLSVLVIKFFMN
jgi:hypothetical protein